MDSPNYQYPTETLYLDGDRGTGAWGIKPGNTGVPETIILSEDFEDTPLDITVTDAGNAFWARSLTTPHTGTWCFKSGTIANSQTSDAVVTIPGGGPNAVRFWYRASSESGFDFFKVLVDAAVVFTASGTVGWAEKIIDLGSATTVTFRYTKDSSGSVGEDAVFIDDLDFIIREIPAVPFKYAPLHITEDDELVVVEGRSDIASAPAQLAQGTTAATIISANADRKGFTVQNTGTTVIKLAFGSTNPTQTAYHVALAACPVADNGLGGYYSDDTFTGDVRAISSGVSGTLVTLEVS